MLKKQKFCTYCYAYLQCVVQLPSHMSHEKPWKVWGFLRIIISKELPFGPFDAEQGHVPTRPRQLHMLRADANSDNQ